MHLLSLALLSIIGLGLLPVHAGTLVGDWYQDGTKDASTDEKRAFAQPYTRSSDTIQVTLGIKSPGVMSPADFYVVVSDTALEPSCLYTVKAIDIDARPFPVKSASHASEMPKFTTKSDTEQKKLWQAFRKGKNLALKISQTCDTAPAQSIEDYTFNFSLEGSSAAYRFVTGQEATGIPAQTKIDNRQPAKPAEPADFETHVNPDDGESILIPLLVSLFIVVVAIKLIRRHAKQDLIDSISPSVIEKKETNFNNRPIKRGTATTATAFSATRLEINKAPQFVSTLTVSDLPGFKVERVIDGDTVIVSRSREKLTIRLSAIDCPEDGQEWGKIATAGLIKLIGGKQVHLETHDTDAYARTVATLYVQHDSSIEWMNVNERMVTLGHAWVMRRFYKHLPKQRQDKLNQLERWAKSKKVGLWKSPDPTPPWNWRRSA